MQPVTINVHTSSRKVPVILVGFLTKRELCRQIFAKNLKYQKSRKFVQWEDELFHADRQGVALA
jgi:hypothetical protein